MNTPAFEPARIECVRGIPVVAITGRLDSTSVPMFDAQAASLLTEAGGRILLDFSRLTFLSTGLCAFVQVAKSAADSEGRAGIFVAPAYILELIEVSGFQPMLDIYPDRETALNGSSE